MLNQIVLVGKVVELPILKESISGNKYASLQLELERPFKNVNGEFDTDIVSVTLWKGIAETTINVCKIGDIIGMKGRIQSYSYENKEGQTYYGYDIIAEKVSFLSNR
ncbi:MAG: single-stranded DNA-binding protein [Erysipelotrichaceae bacterium]|nr:single-stranded DNA-binding protein [Erysipelotrichaceae bacterium]